MEKNKEHKYIIIMRHGERIDDIDFNDISNNNNDNYKSELDLYDPEITSKGISQSFSIANQLLKLFNINNNVKEINLFVSPFTRTILTGLNLCNELSKFIKINNKNIYIVKDLSEFCSEQNFKYNPIDNLLFYNKEKQPLLYEKYINKYIKENNYYFKKLENYNDNYLIYPEDFNNVYNRYNEIGKYIFNIIKNINYNNNDNNDNNYINNENNNNIIIINIIVTHGYGVQIITENYLNLIENKEKDNNIYMIDFCYSFCFDMDYNNKLNYIDLLKPI